jgi:hypothetical protein
MPQLAEKIRTKYPGEYDDLDDHTLEKLVLSKYPEYKDLVVPESNTAPPRTFDNTNIAPSNADTTDPNQFVGPKQSLDKWGVGPANYGPNTESFLSHEFLPEMKQPETWMGGFTKGLYDEFVRPLSSPRNILSGLITGGTGSKIASELGGSEIGAAPQLQNIAKNTLTPEIMQGAKASPTISNKSILDDWGASEGEPTGVYGSGMLPSQTSEGISLPGQIKNISPQPILDESGRELAPPESNNIQPRPEGPWDTMNVSQPNPQSEGLDDLFNRANKKLASGQPSFEQQFGSDYGSGYSGNGKLNDVAASTINNIQQDFRNGKITNEEAINRIQNRVKEISIQGKNKRNELWNDVTNSASNLKDLTDKIQNNINESTPTFDQMTAEGQFSGDRTTGNFEPIDQAGNPIGLDSISPEEWGKIGINKEEPNPWMGESGNDKSPLKRLIFGEEGAVRIKSDDSVLGKLNVGQTVLVKPEKMTPAIYKRMKEQGFEHIGMNDAGSFRWKKVSESGASQPILESEIGNKRPTASRSQLGSPIDVKQASWATEAMNFPRTILASMDMSAPLRQGLGLIHKKEFWNALPTMIKSFGSEEVYQAAMKDIADKPLFMRRMGMNGKEIPSFADDAGLKLTDLLDVKSREESRMSNLAEKLIPGIRGSNRAYTIFLNKLRADTFESLINSGKVFGAGAETNLPLARGIANFVNTATGRGSLGKLEQSAVALNSVLFSPRLIASRLQMLNPQYYIMADPFVRKEALKSLFAIAGAGNIITGLGKLAGGKVEYDPASADFGKLRVGNTRLDPYGGFQQYIVAAQRLMPNLEKVGLPNIGGRMKSTTTGRTYDLGNPKYGQSNRFDVGKRFVQGKLNPVLGFAAALLDAQTELSGKKMNFSTPNPFNNSIGQRFIPILMQDIYEIGSRDPSKLGFAIPDAFGMGVQQYENSASMR